MWLYIIDIISLIHTQYSGMCGFDSMVPLQAYTWFWTLGCECCNTYFQWLYVKLRTSEFCPQKFFEPQRWTRCFSGEQGQKPQWSCYVGALS